MYLQIKKGVVGEQTLQVSTCGVGCGLMDCKRFFLVFFMSVARATESPSRGCQGREHRSGVLTFFGTNCIKKLVNLSI